MLSSHSLDATQGTTVVSQDLAQTQSTVVASHGLPQTQSTVVVSHVLPQTQNTVVATHVLPQTQSTVVASHGFSQTQSTMAVSRDLTSAPTQNTKEVLRPSYVGRDNGREQNNAIRATASTTDFTQANVLITLGILWSYLISWC